MFSILAWFANGARALPDGAVTEVALSTPLALATVDDGLYVELSFSVCRMERCLSQSEIDLARTLDASTFVVAHAGNLMRLRVGHATSSRLYRGLVVRLQAQGVELMSHGSLHGRGASAAWRDGPLSLVRGAARVHVEGAVFDYDGGRHSFQTAPVYLDVQHASRARQSVATLLARLEATPSAYFREPPRPSASSISFLGEDALHRRVFQRAFASDAHLWTASLETISLTPDGERATSTVTTTHTCVAEGSLVTTPRGALPIEQVRPGDLVLAQGISEPAPRWTHVERVLPRGLHEVWEINGRWRLTSEHPVASAGRWLPVGALRPGDALHTLWGPARVERLERASPRRVYDLVVAAPHTFFSDGLLVHNKSVAVDDDALLSYAPDVLTRPELERALQRHGDDVRRCAIGHLQQAADAITVSVRPHDEELTLPGAHDATVNADTRACIHGALAPLRARFPRLDIRVERTFPLAPSPARDSARRATWIEQRAAPLAGCVRALGKADATLRLALFRGRDELAVLELRDARGVPVDQVTQAQREELRGCLERALAHASLGDGAPNTQVDGELSLRGDPPRARWRERP